MNLRIDAKLDDLMRMESVGGRLVPDGLAKNVTDTRYVDEKYWYGIEASAAAYVALVKRRNDYKMYDGALDTLVENLPDIMSKYDCKADTHHPLTCIGIGNAEKEGMILDALLKKQHTVCLTAIERSCQLLLYGIHHIRHRFSKQIGDGRLGMRAVAADYINADVKNGPITMLTIVHNANVGKLLEWCRSHAGSGILLDIETIGGRTDEELGRQYRDMDSKNLLLAPLRLLRDAATESHLEEFSHYAPFAGIGCDPDDVQVEVVTRETGDKFVKKYGLTARSKNMLEQFLHKNQKTVVSLYAPKDEPACIVYHSIRFHEDCFEGMLKKHGFATTGKWGKKGAYGIYYMITRPSISKARPVTGK